MNNTIGEMRSKNIEPVEMSEAPYASTRLSVQSESGNREDMGEIFSEIPDSYKAAIKFFLAKNIITKDEFEKLDKKIRKHAFTVANMDSDKLLTDIRDSINTALANGIPTAEWLQSVDDVFANAGFSKLNEHHLKTVFRTNMQTALNEGKMAIIREADIDEFPLLEFVAIEDDRVRSSHLRLDGFRAPKDDPIWQQLTPPLDYNCRCTLRPVHVSEGLKASDSKDINTEDLGFVN